MVRVLTLHPTPPSRPKLRNFSLNASASHSRDRSASSSSSFSPALLAVRRTSHHHMTPPKQQHMWLPTRSVSHSSATSKSRRVAAVVPHANRSMATMDNYWIKCIGLTVLLFAIIVQPAEGEFISFI